MNFDKILQVADSIVGGRFLRFCMNACLSVRLSVAPIFSETVIRSDMKFGEKMGTVNPLVSIVLL